MADDYRRSGERIAADVQLIDEIRRCIAPVADKLSPAEAAAALGPLPRAMAAASRVPGWTAVGGSFSIATPL